MLNAVFLDSETLGQDAGLSVVRSAVADLVCYPQTSVDQIIERIGSAEIVLTNKVPFDAETLAQLPNLKLICITATGTDHIDLIAAEKQGVIVKNVAGYSTQSVAQLVTTLVLALSSGLPQYDQWTKQGNWQKHHSFTHLEYPFIELTGKTIGFIGYGSIAQQVAKVVTSLGMNILIAERQGADQVRAGRKAFDDVIREADVMSLHCPLTSETKQLINADVIACMKDNAILINTSRGGVIDEQALANAMNQGKFFGVGLDVLSTEPPKPDNPLLSVKHPNFIVTPHIAWASNQAKTCLIQKVADNINNFISSI